MNNACSIKLNGTDYYVACDKVDDLVVIDNHLVNVGSSSLTLYPNIKNYNDSSSYPNIYLPSLTSGVYRSSYNSYETITVNSFSVNNRSFELNSILLLVILGVCLCRLLKA